MWFTTLGKYLLAAPMGNDSDLSEDRSMTTYLLKYHIDKRNLK